MIQCSDAENDGEKRGEDGCSADKQLLQARIWPYSWVGVKMDEAHLFFLGGGE